MGREMRSRGRERRSPAASARGLSTLLSLVTAIAVLTVVTAGTLIVVEDAFRDTQRGDASRAVAIQVSDRLVAPDGPIADRPNVLDAEAVDALAEDDLEALDASDRFAVAVALDGERLASVGDPRAGHVVRRIVLVERSQRVTRTPPVSAGTGHEVTLPVRTDAVNLTLDPPAGTNVTTVRSDGRVVLHDPDGLEGTYRVRTARYDTLRFAFETDGGQLSTGDVAVAYESTSREKAILAVTVSDRTSARPGGESV